MMPFIRTMSIAFRLLYIMSTVYGNVRRNSSQDDSKHVKYYDPISAAHLSSQRPLKFWDDYFNKSARRRSNVGVVLPAVVPGLPLRGDRRRLLAYDVDQVTSSTRASPRLVKRDLPNAVLCLVVACLALMVILLCLSIAALWLRCRYRTKDKAIYTTLSYACLIWSREIKRNSVSEPALSSAKVADYSPDNGLNSPLRSPSDGDKASAKLTDSSEVKMTPFPAVMTVSEDGRKSLRVKSTEAPLPLRSYSIERTNTAGRQPTSGHLSDHRDSIVRTIRSGKRKRSQGRISVDKGYSGPFDVARGSRNADSAVDSPAPATAKRTGTGGHLSEDYQQDSYSDEADHSYTMADDSSPWTQLLALCAETKEVQFQQIIEDNCEAQVLPWNDGSGGHMFCLGSSPAEERLVHVTPLRPQDASTHAKRIRMASELSELRSSRNNQDVGILRGCQFTELAQLESVLEQACLALAVAEAAVQFEHRLPIIDTVLIRPTRSPRVEYTLWGNLERIPSAGFKIRLQGLHVARMTIDGKAEYTDLSRHRQFIVGEKELHVFDKIADTLG
ncbi:hypothetical protein MRX96_022506 [Rhipicephalus microplus]